MADPPVSCTGPVVNANRLKTPAVAIVARYLQSLWTTIECECGSIVRRYTVSTIVQQIPNTWLSKSNVDQCVAYICGDESKHCHEGISTISTPTPISKPTPTLTPTPTPTPSPTPTPTQTPTLLPTPTSTAT